MAQDVAFDELEAGSSSGSGALANVGGGAAAAGGSLIQEEDKMKNLDAFLETLPVLSVGQKHSARFECELNNKETGSNQQQPQLPVSLVKVSRVLSRKEVKFFSPLVL